MLIALANFNLIPFRSNSWVKLTTDVKALATLIELQNGKWVRAERRLQMDRDLIHEELSADVWNALEDCHCLVPAEDALDRRLTSKHDVNEIVVPVSTENNQDQDAVVEMSDEDGLFASHSSSRLRMRAPRRRKLLLWILQRGPAVARSMLWVRGLDPWKSIDVCPEVSGLIHACPLRSTYWKTVLLPILDEYMCRDVAGIVRQYILG